MGSSDSAAGNEISNLGPDDPGAFGLQTTNTARKTKSAITGARILSECRHCDLPLFIRVLLESWKKNQMIILIRSWKKKSTAGPNRGGRYRLTQ
jgi:hypothetical protein